MLTFGLVSPAGLRAGKKLLKRTIGLMLMGLSAWHLLTPSVPVQAQTATPPGQANLFVHAIEETSATFPNTAVPALQVRVTFSAYDGQGSVIKGDMKSSALDLETINYSALIGRVQGDASIVVLMDTSLTLANSTAAPDFQRLLQRTSAARR